MPKYSEDEGAPQDTGETMSEGMHETPPQEPGSEEGSTFFISPQQLGQHLDPDSVKPGDILEFKVVGRDKDGDIEVAYNTGEDGSAMDKMKSNLATHMEAPAQPGGQDGQPNM